MTVSATETRLEIGALVFPGIDQVDLTGPFEVLAQLPGARFQLLAKEIRPVRDLHGLLLTPDAVFGDAPPLDVLVVPGGFGQLALMEDEAVLEFLRSRAAQARIVFSVCTGALTCGAAGLLRGVRATTHWSAHALLPYFGAIPVNERVVVDGKFVSAAGVTAGIDGALRVAALLCGEAVAQGIQLAIEYAPEPPFASGTPETAPAEIFEAAQARVREITTARRAAAVRISQRLGVKL